MRPDQTMQKQGFSAYEFDDGAYRHIVYVKDDGPNVIVMHESPGLEEHTVQFLDKLAGRGFSRSRASSVRHADETGQHPELCAALYQQGIRPFEVESLGAHLPLATHAGPISQRQPVERACRRDRHVSDRRVRHSHGARTGRARWCHFAARDSSRRALRSDGFRTRSVDE